MCKNTFQYFIWHIFFLFLTGMAWATYEVLVAHLVLVFMCFIWSQNILYYFCLIFFCLPSRCPSYLSRFYFFTVLALDHEYYYSRTCDITIWLYPSIYYRYDPITTPVHLYPIWSYDYTRVPTINMITCPYLCTYHRYSHMTIYLCTYYRCDHMTVPVPLLSIWRVYSCFFYRLLASDVYVSD